MLPSRSRAFRSLLVQTCACACVACAAFAACSNNAPAAPDAIVEAGPADSALDAPASDGALVTPAEQSNFEALMTFAQQHIDKVKAPGAAIAVLLRGRLAFARGVGVKRAGGSDRVTEATLFSLASLSKVITAVAALSVAESGGINLADPVAKHLTAAKLLPASAAQNITLSMLLQHSSGITNYTPANLGNVGLDFQSPTLLVSAFERADWQTWAPAGAVWNYSNRGYALAGAMLQHAAGKDFAAVVAERVFAPAGMTTATLSGADAAQGDHTAGHGSSKAGGPIEPGAAFTTGYLDAPNNGVYASVTDVARLAEALLADGGAVLPKSRADELTARHADLTDQLDGYGYAYGLYRTDREGSVSLEHGGGNEGWSANLLVLPDERVAVVALVNHSGGQPWVLTGRARELFAKPAPRPKAFDRLAVSELSKIAGSYNDAFGRLGRMTLSTTSKPGELSVVFDSNPSSPTTMAQNGPYFFAVAVPGNGGVTVQVYRDASGKGQYLVTRIGVAVRE